MALKAIHQIVAGYTNGDAISNEARTMRAIFRSWGLKSDIFCDPQSILPALKTECYDVASLAGQVDADDIALLHFSIGSEVNNYLTRLPCRKVLRYDNITPPEFFTPVNAATASKLRLGRQQLKSLSQAASLNIPISSYNADELREHGYSNIRTLPIILDRKSLDEEPDRKVLKELSSSQTNILFVGRCAPNKRIEDLVKQFYYYRRFYNKNSRLIHVGSFSGTERYLFLIKSLVKDLGLYESVKFMGSIPQSQLNACYRASSLFLSMSEHEGFCIPLIEAMYHQVPVAAFSCTAIPYTMDGAGVLFEPKNYELVAHTMHEVIGNDEVRRGIIAAQNRRLERYFALDFEKELRDMLMTV